MYIYYKDGTTVYPYSLRELRKNVSLAAGKTDFSEYSVFPVSETSMPEASVSQIVEEDSPALIDGQWVQRWAVRDKTPDEMAAARSNMIVTMAQARKALHAAGKLAGAEAALAGLSEPGKSIALIDWEYSTTVRRMSPWVVALGPALGLDDAALDALFETAAKL